VSRLGPVHRKTCQEAVERWANACSTQPDRASQIAALQTLLGSSFG